MKFNLEQTASKDKVYLKVEGKNTKIAGIELLFYLKIKSRDTFTYLDLIEFGRNMRIAIGDNRHSSETEILFSTWPSIPESEAVCLKFIPVRSTNNIKAPISSITKVLKEWIDLSDFFEIYKEIELFLSKYYIDDEHVLEILNCILDNMFGLLTDEERLLFEVGKL